MLNVATGFAVIGLAIAVGYVIGRINLLGPQAGPVLGRLVFFVLSPVLLFVVLSEADIATLFSALLPVSAITAIIIIGLYAAISRLVWRRPVGDTLIGALAAGQVNSNNIGIPLSLYLLGSAAYPAPVILFQLLVLVPISMAILESVTAATRNVGKIVIRTVTNPVVIGSVAGTLVAATGLELPSLVTEPLHFLAAACVPVLLLSYGMSLHGQRVLAAGGHRREVIVATAFKLILMPLLAWVLASVVFGLPRAETLTVVVLASLPTAQNVFNFAQRFGVAETVARDTVFLTTIGCIPVLIGVLVLFG